MALFSQPTPLNLTFKDDTERVDGVRASANLFSLLGVQPMMGRSFSADEAERKERVVVLSHGLWLRRFGGEANGIGKSLWIEGRSSQIIGVMPAGFDFPGKQSELWEPHTSHPRWDTLKADRYYDQWGVVGRFKPKVTPQQAQAEMTAIGEALAKEYPTQDPDFAGFGVNVVPLMAQVVGTKTPLALAVLFGAVILVLLIACANVAGLLLARGTARAREIAIRTALGATRAHLTRQLLAEGTVLALGGGAFGVLLAEAAIRSLVAIGTNNLPRLNEISINAVVLIFAAGVSLVSGMICTVAPADRKSTRLNSSHLVISYAVFCLKKKQERSGINTILHELNPLFTINVTMRAIKSKNVYSRVNSKATTQWRKTESANGVYLEGVASDNRSS